MTTISNELSISEIESNESLHNLQTAEAISELNSLELALVGGGASVLLF